MRVAGVDEAGRGCLVGPLVVAGALFRDSDVPRLKELGVRDSKKLTPKRRGELAEEIRGLALDIRFFQLQPRSIDAVVERNQKLHKLNYLEAMAMAKVIRDLSPDEVYVDASDVDAERYGDCITRVLRVKPKLVSEHKADVRYLVVSAASVVAKVTRDAAVAALREKHGDFNSGYPSDEQTIRWLEGYLKEHEGRCDFIRYSWQPVKSRLKREA